MFASLATLARSQLRGLFDGGEGAQDQVTCTAPEVKKN